MASPRFLVFALLALIAVVSAKNDLIIGHREPYDYLARRDEVKRDASYIGLVVTATETFTTRNNARITEIRALDQHTNGHGAKATLIAGGSGFNYVTLRFESERFRAIDFIVELYAK